MPIDTPYRARFEARIVARIHFVTPRQEIRSSMHNAIREISVALEAAGVARTGPWIMHLLRPPTDTFDVDVCFPIDKPFPQSGRVATVEIPAVEVLRTIHHGGYEKLPQAWQDFSDWISARGFQTRGDAFEVYSVGPKDNEDPSCWKTELNNPLANDQDNTPATN
jgi:effector-binding domain-containing protein